MVVSASDDAGTATRFLTQTTNGMGTAVGSSGGAQEIFDVLTVRITNVISSTTPVQITEANFVAAFGSDTIDVNGEIFGNPISGGNLPADFTDSATAVFTVATGSTSPQQHHLRHRP